MKVVFGGSWLKTVRLTKRLSPPRRKGRRALSSPSQGLHSLQGNPVDVGLAGGLLAGILRGGIGIFARAFGGGTVSEIDGNHPRLSVGPGQRRRGLQDISGPERS